MKKLILFVLTGLLLMSSSFAFAAGTGFQEVDVFRYSNERTGYTQAITAKALYPTTVEFTGKSYSQPLIVDGSKFGSDTPVVIVPADNYLWGIRLRSPDDTGLYNKDGQYDGAMLGNIAFGPVPLFKGTKPTDPTASHTTLAKLSGQDLLFTGSRDGYLFIHDLSGKEKRAVNLQGSDIVSAPLVVYWKGHPLVVAGNGDGGDAVIVYNLENGVSKFTKVHIGGRISSSPAPLEDKGFIIGSDGGNVVRAYNFSDILEEKDGTLVDKPGDPEYIWQYKTSSGVPASFAVVDDVIYFSSKDGVMRCLGIDGTQYWKNTEFMGSYINHSPAVDDKYVYFPIADTGRGKGAVVILKKGTGQLVKTLDFDSRVTTAPVVTDSQIFIGTEGGYLAIFDKSTWEKRAFGIYDNILYKENAGNTPRRSVMGGFASEITVSGNWLVTLGETSVASEPILDPLADQRSNVNGIMIAYTLLAKAPDFYVKSVDTGVPQGQKAVPGQTYTGKVTFASRDCMPDHEVMFAVDIVQKKNEGQSNPILVPNEGMYNYTIAEKLKLSGDIEGQDDEDLIYYSKMNPEEEKTYTFQYVAKEPYITIHAEIQPNTVKAMYEGKETIGLYYQDINTGDNYKDIKIEAGQQSVVPSPGQKPVDLEMVSLTAPSKWTDIEKKFTVTARYRNNSDQTISTVILITANGEIRTEGTVTLKPGETKTTSISIGGKPNTTYNLKAIIDPDNKIKETNENNNSKTAKTVVGPAQTQDILPPDEGGVRAVD